MNTQVKDSLPTASESAIRAYVHGQAFVDMPEDLFIPPDALEVLLDSFSGPLDLLLYLIKKQNIDIFDIPIVQITQQYLQYIQAMEAKQMELAAEYLLMAAMLAEIKSRMLLPIKEAAQEEEDFDPRMALVEKLKAYEQIKYAAQALDHCPRQERDVFLARSDCSHSELPEPLIPVELSELLSAMQSLISREAYFSKHQISTEPLSVKARMTAILNLLMTEKRLELKDLYQVEEGRAGIIVSLLAILELARKSLLYITQTQAFSPIYIQAVMDE